MTNPKITSKTVIYNQNTNIFKDVYNFFDQKQSKNMAFQLQNNFKINNTKFVWGMDFFRTEASTNGSILNDGPNGYDNDGDYVISHFNGFDDDGDNALLINDGIDNNNNGIIDEPTDGVDDEYCSDGKLSGFRNGKLWECYEGIDEPDEFIDPTTNEYGIYYQSTSQLFGTSRFQLITCLLYTSDAADE